MSVMKSIRLGNRELALRVSRRAQAELARMHEALSIEMELYFSCLLRKRVNFLGAERAGTVATAPLSENVQICFRPVMTRSCAIDETAGAPELEAFPIQRADAFLPRWLNLDHRAGKWFGEFGY